MSPTVKANDVVAYVPHLCHSLDRDAGGAHLFEHEHVADGPIRKGKPSYHQGETANLGSLGSLRHEDGARRDPKTGVVTTAGGHPVRATRPARAWKAIVLAVKEDGTLDLEIDHPHGHKLEYCDVPYSADQLNAPHSWHLPEGA